ncbi:hypothetical protein NDU88_008668 [Pleurodeles waltl]|uniref:Uncharacterized protein n=1 Tax=Pleurodeles waltl TaxID=8319 RepID=A0AAV7N9S2_PLEWA|nr:hypothetical protein NDU88_008668 [Pleurodeles waltl]
MQCPPPPTIIIRHQRDPASQTTHPIEPPPPKTLRRGDSEPGAPVEETACSATKLCPLLMCAMRLTWHNLPTEAAWLHTYPRYQGWHLPPLPHGKTVACFQRQEAVPFVSCMRYMYIFPTQAEYSMSYEDALQRLLP